MDMLNSVGLSVVSFIGIFSVLVFFHELGHFWVARRFGIRVEAFSIGFGPSLLRWTDRLGTEWRIAALPLGGYVRFFGDASGASNQQAGLEELSEADRRDCFHFRPLYQRAAVVFAGPFANFLLAIVLFGGLFMVAGQHYTTPEVSAVLEDSAAHKAGLQVGDLIVELDGVGIETFEELHSLVSTNPGRPMDITYERDGQLITTLTTIGVVTQDTLVGPRPVGRLGVMAEKIMIVDRGPLEAFWYATMETRDMTVFVFRTIGELVTAKRSIKDVGGPVLIGRVSGIAAEQGMYAVIMLAALLSINLGLVNLLPVPMLDGGHLLFYFFEAVRGKPLGERTQEYGFRLGLALVLMLMVVVTWNDIANLAS